MSTYSKQYSKCEGYMSVFFPPRTYHIPVVFLKLYVMIQ